MIEPDYDQGTTVALAAKGLLEPDTEVVLYHPRLEAGWAEETVRFPLLAQACALTLALEYADEDARGGWLNGAVRTHAADADGRVWPVVDQSEHFSLCVLLDHDTMASVAYDAARRRFGCTLHDTSVEGWSNVGDDYASEPEALSAAVAAYGDCRSMRQYLTTACFAADAAWQSELEAVYGRDAGNARYDACRQAATPRLAGLRQAYRTAGERLCRHDDERRRDAR